MTGKKVTSQSITGQLGANLIERVVLRMKNIWRPIQIFDVGIDGEIELCDPITGVATNAIIRVQAKATTLPFQAETPESFEYTCTQKDLDYWLFGNAPVILIVCRPDTDEAYWVSVKDHFKDTSLQKTKKVRFNKLRDRFDLASSTRLMELGLPKDSGIYFAPLPKRELLYTNLLEVVSFAPQIFIAETDFRSPGDIWRKFKAMRVRAGSEWMLSNKRIISFRDLDAYPFNTICDAGTCERFDTSEWAYSDDSDRKREFVRLLNLCLQERTHLLGLRYYDTKKLGYFYFPATRTLGTREVRYQSIKVMAKREVFKQYGQKADQTKRAFCRHSAFKGYFVSMGEKWYLEITPTYHFTIDGYREDRFRAQRLKGIKQLERNPAVLGHLLMWVDFLHRPIGDLFSQEYSFLDFGKLQMVEIETGLPDEVWYGAEEGDDAASLKNPVNQPRLFGL